MLPMSCDQISGASANKVPTRPMPDLVLRIVALFQRPDTVRPCPSWVGNTFSPRPRAKAVLAWEPRPAAATIIDSARSVIALGAG